MQTDPQDAGEVNKSEAAAPAPTDAAGSSAASSAGPSEVGVTGAPEAGPPAGPSEVGAKPPAREIEHHPDEATIKENIIGVLRTIFDPEIPVNIYDIGLIYAIEVDTDARAYVNMTLTSPMCPVAGTLPGEVEMKISGAPGVDTAHVELVWDPPWGMEKMSEAARLQLNL